MGFRPDVRYSFVLSDLGLNSGLRLCLDAGDVNSYASGQKWLDTSGNGYDFFMGASGSTESSDPVFTGVPGALSQNEYWACDSDAAFTYDSANETWMNNLHKDGATFTCLAWIYITSQGSTLSPSIFGTSGTNADPGVIFSVTASTGLLKLRYGNGTVATNLTSSGAAVALNGWHLVGVSINENGGASAGQFYLDGAANGAAFNPSYTTPSASAAFCTMQVASDGNNLRQLGLNGAARIGAIMIWEGTVLTAAQIAAIYNYQPAIKAATRPYAVTANVAPLSVTIASTPTSFSHGGNAATFKPAMGGGIGACAIAGLPALTNIVSPVVVGGYSVGGSAATFTPRLSSFSGSFTIVPNAAALAASIASVAGFYVVTGFEAGLMRDFEAWFPRPFDADHWTVRAVEGETWTTEAQQSGTWVPKAEPVETWTSAIKQSENWERE
jgi:hypothetical protein